MPSDSDSQRLTLTLTLTPLILIPVFAVDSVCFENKHFNFL